MIEKNIEWYGTLPKNWSTPKMSYVCNTITDYTASGSFASLAENVIYRDTEDYAMLVRTADLSKKRDINPVFIDEKAYNFLNNSNLFGGELIMSNVGSVGDVYLYEPLYQKASLAPNAIMVRTNGYEKFLFYLFSTKQAVEGLLSITNTTTQPKFNKTQLRSFRVPFPDQLTMEKIVKHLDKKTKQIEDIKNKISEEIENLENYKKSVITEAVTKGLDKNVEMKDSGIEWIGEIPKHWKKIELRYLSSIVRGGSPRPISNYMSDSDTDLNWIKIGDTEKGSKYINRTKNKLKISGLSSTTYVKKGELILSNSMSYGEAYILNIDGCIHDGWLAFKEIKNVDQEYLYFSLLSTNTLAQFDMLCDGGVVQNLNIDKVKTVKVFIPNLDEQIKIADYLNKKTKLIDDSIAIKQKQLKTLEEYKKSLIYEYVTGKKEVKDGEES